SYPQKVRARTIGRFGFAEIRVVFRAKLPTGVKPNLIQHAREVHHSAGFLLWTLRIDAHDLSHLAVDGDDFEKKQITRTFDGSPFVLSRAAQRALPSG